MHGTIVGVLRGGPSSEHEISLKTGHAIVANLPRDRYTVRDIYIDRQGIWHERGKPSTPADILRTLDVIFIALHGAYGEDGEVQRLLERFGVPYTGSNSMASRIAIHKARAKEQARATGLKTARYRLVSRGEDLDQAAYDLTRNFHQPLVIKPATGGSSIGVQIVGGYLPLRETLAAMLIEEEQALVEEYIRGIEATAGVVEGLRNENIYQLPPIEIIPPRGDFFSYDAKYGGISQAICPGRFSKEITEELMRSARAIHEALGLRHYSRSDFMVAPSGVYYLETNTLPGLTKESSLSKSLAAVGIELPEFLSHLVELAKN